MPDLSENKDVRQLNRDYKTLAKNYDDLGKAYKTLADDVTELKFDNEKVLKPTLVEIKEIVSRDIYVTKPEYAELKKTVADLQQDYEDLLVRIRHYDLIEKLVFGLVGLIVTAVVVALIALVVVKK